MKNISPPGGLEPPTFRLTAERASQLRHGGLGWTALDNLCFLNFSTFQQETKTNRFSDTCIRRFENKIVIWPVFYLIFTLFRGQRPDKYFR